MSNENIGNIFDKIKEKKKIAILCVIIFGIVLFILFSSKGSFGLLVNSNGNNFKSEYEKYNGKESNDGKKYLDITINGAEKIKYSNEDEILEIFNNSLDGVIYFGYPTCGYCRTAAEVLLNTAKNTNLETIYYLDTENGLSNNFIQNVDDKFLIDKNGKKEINDPLVLFVTNGVVVSYNIGTIVSHEDPSVEMDAGQISALEFIYQHGIQDVLNVVKLKNVD